MYTEFSDLIPQMFLFPFPTKLLLIYISFAWHRLDPWIRAIVDGT